MPVHNTPSGCLGYQYFPFKDKETATFLHEDVLLNEATDTGSALDPGWCRFTCSELISTPEQQLMYIYNINTEIKKHFPDSRSPHRIEFPATFEGQQYIDIDMGSVHPSRWTADMKAKLPGGQAVIFCLKGVIPRHYISMSIAYTDHTHDLTQICKALYIALLCTSESINLIEDVWTQHLYHPDWPYPETVSIGKIIFVIELLERKDSSEDPDSSPASELSDHEEGSDKEASEEQDVLIPVSDIKAAVQSLPGWLAIPRGEDLKLLFRNRPEWCSRCKANAATFHTLEQCPAAPSTAVIFLSGGGFFATPAQTL